MADRTIQILPGGSSSAPYTYTVPASSAFMLQAVRAVFDGSAATGFLPCVQIYSDAGELMVETLGTAVSAGGSADVSFFPLRRTTTGAAASNYAALVGSISTAGTLRGYWRLGETVGNFADTSNFQPTHPADLQITGTGSNTRGVTGVIGPTQDDGAWQINVKGNPSPGNVYGQPVGTSTSFLGGTKSNFTVVGWVRPTATIGGDPSWRGAIFGNSTIIAAAPSFERGWALCLYFPGAAASPQPQFYRTSDGAHGGFVAATGSSMVIGGDYMLAATFDGATISLYVNGALAATQADTVRDLADDASPTIGIGQQGEAFGIIDEVAVWGVVLSAGQIAELYAAGTS